MGNGKFKYLGVHCLPIVYCLSIYSGVIKSHDDAHFLTVNTHCLNIFLDNLKFLRTYR